MRDALGAVCSGLCLIHCLALPVLAATGTTFIGFAMLSSESTHLWLCALMMVFALWAFPSGWRAHKCLWPGLLAIAAAVLVLLALFASEAEETYWIASSLTLIGGHLMNRYLLRARASL
ncbi:MerC domain-containing protein [Simiduia curdlanivorans]|uniref:MerC domain-containing protein n=1 Tax=Simiduia curdlanivorans TaxID=1492769 RepID=A0ABV8VC83_9GAMM|nr:MerC domain-containing protein [Simiduia curdlanivorans]MDN3639325.1 MerC domain-containing protein [Simiduia curdlanivorans]